jgi:hypothetical protein
MLISNPLKKSEKSYQKRIIGLLPTVLKDEKQQNWVTCMFITFSVETF